MTFNEFLLLLSREGITAEDIAHEKVEWEALPGVGMVTMVQEKENAFTEYVSDCDGISGYEEVIFKVYHAADHDFYFKLEGIDDSYGESHWKKFPYQVQPVTKEITEYISLQSEVAGGKYTAEQILLQLKLKGISNEDLGRQDVDWEETGLGTVALAEEHGGYEGQGEDCHKVYYFKDHEVYLRIDGFYASYEGSEWDNDPYEVRPQQKQITVYNKPGAPQ